MQDNGIFICFWESKYKTCPSLPFVPELQLHQCTRSISYFEKACREQSAPPTFPHPHPSPAFWNFDLALKITESSKIWDDGTHVARTGDKKDNSLSQHWRRNGEGNSLFHKMLTLSIAYFPPPPARLRWDLVVSPPPVSQHAIHSQQHPFLICFLIRICFEIMIQTNFLPLFSPPPQCFNTAIFSLLQQLALQRRPLQSVTPFPLSFSSESDHIFSAAQFLGHKCSVLNLLSSKGIS